MLVQQIEELIKGYEDALTELADDTSNQEKRKCDSINEEKLADYEDETTFLFEQTTLELVRF